VDEVKVPVTVAVGWSPAARSDALRMLAAGSPGGLAAITAEPLEAPPGTRLVTAPEQVAERSLGCPCCAVRLDVHRAVHRLLARRRPPERIAVIAGRRTDPGPLLATLLCDVLFARRASLEATVVVVDGPQAAVRLATGSPLAPGPRPEEHLALADAVVVAGAERLTDDARRAVAAAVRAGSPFSPVVEIDGGAPAGRGPDLVPAAGAYSLDGVAARLDHLAPPGHPLPCAALIDLDGEAQPDDLRDWARGLFRERGGELLRLQAVCSVAGQAERWACSAVRSFYATGPCSPSPTSARGARVLAVGRHLDVAGLAASLRTVVRSGP
jgi:G3E family GTPase